MRQLTLFLAILILSGCSSVELRQERDMCKSTWMSKIPPIYEQEMYNKSQTRKVPTGYTTCTGYGNSVSCYETMRTEYYTVPAVRTVDINSDRRDAEIKYCTQNNCKQKFGNAECKI